MNIGHHVITESALHRIMRRVAVESMVTTAAYCGTRSSGRPPHSYDSDGLEEDLAWIAARATERGCDLLPVDAQDAQAPISCAVIELVEWAEHLVRFEALGDGDCRVPLTWLPRGDHSLGGRDVAAAVEERLELLRHELSDYGVLMIAPREVGLAA